MELVHLRGIVGVGLVEETDVEELDAKLHAAEALRLGIGREGDAPRFDRHAPCWAAL